MKGRLDALLKEAVGSVDAAHGDKDALLNIKARYLGRKGGLSAFLKDLANLPADDRKPAGEAINRVKGELEKRIDDALRVIEEGAKEVALAKDRLDVTLPGRAVRLGRIHPVSRVMAEIEAIFRGLGFSVAEGPEIEHDYYNFEALNIPKDHPARDMQDTFYVTEDVLLRTHTSPVQIRHMKLAKPPVRIIAPGTVYRKDSDVTHTPMFHQVEVFMVDKGVSFANLKGVLTQFFQSLFGADTAIRLRPSFFPFTEPSAEVDIRCVICKGAGCRVCKGSGWLEILGAGMIHPEVFKSVGYDSEDWSGFAFGMGVERIAMLKYGIDDLRLFFENDLRFIRQF
ncbi:MAG: phenylalanine--tRNA ligase subunit alpha [Deltaproteobacteria bacterium RIFCSPLOWO2_02_FULL_53_8]|nr:MAG: phenylalanine--tRNA ligase subunit alpha [Deltaproteobacteria bacterium RIFCSPLOWO2_02_FULL_53_8]